MNSLEHYQKILKQRLPGKRYDHSVNVMACAVKLAAHHGLPRELAAEAALLHDYAKNLNPEELRAEADAFRLELDPVASKHLMLAHGPIGAEMVRRDLGIVNEDVLNAIRYHTVARVGMSPLEKLIYLADFIEPGRRFKGVEELRRLAEQDLDLAVLRALESSIGYLLGSDRLIHPNTLHARNELVMKQNVRRHHGFHKGTGV